jgi:hypothetical protein
MSLEKEIDLRSKKMTIYSSEMKERMKIYFKLQKKYEKCFSSCPKEDEESRLVCSNLCDKVFDQYSQILYDRYKDNPEKLLEKVENSPMFKTKKKEFTKSLWYRLFLVPSPFHKEQEES